MSADRCLEPREECVTVSSKASFECSQSEKTAGGNSRFWAQCTQSQGKLFFSPLTNLSLCHETLSYILNLLFLTLGWNIFNWQMPTCSSVYLDLYSSCVSREWNTKRQREFITLSRWLKLHINTALEKEERAYTAETHAHLHREMQAQAHMHLLWLAVMSGYMYTGREAQIHR